MCFLAVIFFADLGIQGPEIVDPADSEEAAGEQVKNARNYFSQVKTVDAKQPEEGEQDPGDRVVGLSGFKTQVGLAIHRWNEEEIDKPPNSKQAESEKPDSAADGFAIVESMRAGEAKDPQQIADELAMGISSIDGSGWDIGIGQGGWGEFVVHDEEICCGLAQAPIRKLAKFCNRLWWAAPMNTWRAHSPWLAMGGYQLTKSVSWVCFAP